MLNTIMPDQAHVLADLGLTTLQGMKTIHVPRIAALVTACLAGKVNDLALKEIRAGLSFLIKRASHSGLDVIGDIFGIERATTGQFSETDEAFAARLKLELGKPLLSEGDQLVGVSFRTALHFHPGATLAQQEAAIQKAVTTAEGVIAQSDVDRFLRVNHLWYVLRLVAREVVIDVGAPNRPFEEILLWREGKPEPLTGDYILKPGERLIVEPSIAIPIDIRPSVITRLLV